jgi:hypothetical protein
VQCAEQLVGLTTDDLHDVDLAVGRPVAAAEHPEGGPQAGTVGHLDPRLDPSVLLGELPRGLDAAGGELAGAVPAVVVPAAALTGGDDQMALPVHGDVARAVGVVLQLLVAPAVAAGVEIPLRRVDATAGRTVEIFVPDDRSLGGVTTGADREAGAQGHREGGGRDEEP